MWQIDLTNGNKKLSVYLACDPFTGIFPAVSEVEQKIILKNLANHFFDLHYLNDQPFITEPEEKVIFLKNLRFSPTDYTHITALYAYQINGGQPSAPAVQTFNLHGATNTSSHQFSFSTETNLITEALFRKIFDTVSLLKWPEPPISQFDETFIDFTLASNQNTKQAIASLCQFLNLSAADRQVTVHFNAEYTIEHELGPLVDQHTPHYIQHISARMQRADENEPIALNNFIAKEKALLLAEMKQIKRKKISAMVADKMADKPGNYSSVISASLPSRYMHLESTYHYIKKNLVIALYNAARDYYQKIWHTYRHDPDKFLKKIENFNEKFTGIAKINLNTLTMSPLTDALAHTEYLYLTHHNENLSLEALINKLIKRSAHENSLSLHTQYGEAFRCIKERLNQFNKMEYLDPLTEQIRCGNFFTPIYAPGENSMTAPLLMLPFARKAAEIANNVSELYKGEQKEFAFNDTVTDLADKILAAKEAFRGQLANMRDYIESAKMEAETMLKCDEEGLHDIDARNNIESFADLIRQQTSIHATIKKIKQAIDKRLNELQPALNTQDTLIDLSLQNGFTTQQSTDLANSVMDENHLDALKKHQLTLQKLKRTLAIEHDNLAQFVEHTSHQTTLKIDDQFNHAHDSYIRGMNDRLAAAGQEAKNIFEKIHKIAAKQDCALHLINALKINLATVTQLAEFTLAHATLPSILPNLFSSNDNMHAPVIKFYEQVHQGYHRLKKDVNNQHQLLQSLLTHFAHDSQAYALLSSLITKLPIHLNNTKTACNEQQNTINKLLLCHLLGKAILNIEHWHAITTVTDSTVAVEANERRYRIPKPISALIALVKTHGFTDSLLPALFEQAKHPSSNHQVEKFLAYLRNPQHISPPANPNNFCERVAALQRMMPTFTPTLITAEQFSSIKRIPSYWEKHRVLKKILTGCVIGLGMIAATALVVGLMVATGGIALAAIIATGVITAAVLSSAGVAAAHLTRPDSRPSPASFNHSTVVAFSAFSTSRTPFTPQAEAAIVPKSPSTSHQTEEPPLMPQTPPLTPPTTLRRSNR